MAKELNPAVAVVMGSDSDFEVMKPCFETLKEFGISYEARVISAHRTPALATAFASEAQSRGLKLIIAGAGAAAHLAGVIAACTTLPVIGVPISASSLQGFDALLSTVMMPAGVPVATVALNKMGAKNAAILAVQMLALSDAKLATKLIEYKEQLKNKVVLKNENLAKRLEEIE